MARTRSSKGAAGAAAKSSAAPSTSSTTSRFTIPPESTNPPKLFILPSKATPEARVVSLLNPRYNKPTRYLVCPDTGTYEFTRIAAPKTTTPRSWLIEGARAPATAAGDADGFRAQVTRGAELYVATPIDPFFLVLPALAAQLGAERRLFLSSDDHLDTVAERSPHQREALRRGAATRRLFEARMAAACDSVEAGDEPMFRLSEDKVLAEVLAKARRMSEAGLPPSMEERFVTKALEAPILSVKSNHGPAAEAGPRGAASSGAGTPATESAESQSGASTADTAASSASDAPASTAATSAAGSPSPDAAKTSDVTAAMQASREVVGLQRLRVAFGFICSSYVPPALAEALKEMLAAGRGSVDFAPLDDYVARLARARQEALLARSASDYTGKRMREEEAEERAEKRRKKEEEEKRRKASESRGVRDLKKVNVSGMKKMSDFFKKK